VGEKEPGRVMPSERPYLSLSQKHRGESVKDFFKREFDYQREDGTYGKIIDCAVVNLQTAYIAYQLRRKAPGFSHGDIRHAGR